MSPFSIAAALGSMDTVLSGYGRRLSMLIGTLQPEATTALKFALPGSHSLKSPFRMRRLGTPAETTVPSRNLVQLCDQKKKVFSLSLLWWPGIVTGPPRLYPKMFHFRGCLKALAPGVLTALFRKKLLASIASLRTNSYAVP